MSDGPALTLEVLGDIEVTVSVTLGSARRTIKEILALHEDSVLPLNVGATAPVHMLVNGVPVATGEIVELEDGSLAIEIDHVRADATSAIE